MVSIDRSDEQNPFPADVVAAVLDHMNSDHLEDSVNIVATCGGRPDATSAVMVGLDGTCAEFDVDGPEGPSRVTVPWSAPITERTEIRAELARMVNEAAGS